MIFFLLKQLENQKKKGINFPFLSVISKLLEIFLDIIQEIHTSNENEESNRLLKDITESIICYFNNSFDWHSQNIQSTILGSTSISELIRSSRETTLDSFDRIFLVLIRFLARLFSSK